MNYSVTFYMYQNNLDIKDINQEDLNHLIQCYKDRYPFCGNGICLRMDEVKYFTYQEQ